jgi:hypothetical protein
MAFAVQMHQVEFIDQSLPLEQVQRPVDGAAIYRSVHGPRLAQDLAGRELPISETGSPLIQMAVIP